MELVINTADCSKELKLKQPMVLVARKGREFWMVLDQSITAPRDKNSWSLARQADQIAIPIFPFDGKKPLTLVQLGFLVSSIVNVAPLKGKVKKTYLHFGTSDASEDLTHLGVAFLLESE